MLNIRLSELAAKYNLQFKGNDVIVRGFNLSNRHVIADSVLTYAETEKYLRCAINNPKVSAVVTTEEMSMLSLQDQVKVSFLLTDYPEHTFYSIYIDLVASGILGRDSFKTDLSSVSIGEGSVIENGVRFGKNVRIGNNTVIRSGTVIGDNVSIGNCSVIGSEGFQLIKDRFGNNMDIPHIGGVYIGNHVSIGDCVTVCKSLFEGSTEIGDYTKIDNHVHIAHNCVIGKNCSITAHCVMFGSSYLEDNVWLAPNSMIMNGAVVGNNSFVGAASFVEGKIPPDSKLFGIPAKQIEEYIKEQVKIKRCIKLLEKNK